MNDESDDVATATSIVRAYKQATPSLLQRRMEIDYANAYELLGQLEKLRIVSPADDEGHRRVL